MAEPLTAWLFSAREVLARKSGWQADRQMDRQAHKQRDRGTGGRTDRETGHAELQTERQGERLPDRHAPLVAGQAVGVGRRRGDSKCLWQGERVR